MCTLLFQSEEYIENNFIKLGFTVDVIMDKTQFWGNLKPSLEFDISGGFIYFELRYSREWNCNYHEEN